VGQRSAPHRHTPTQQVQKVQPFFHLAAFYLSLAASQTDLAMTPVVDPQLTSNANGFLLPEAMTIQQVYASGLGVTQGRINVPSLRAVTLPRINPVNHALYPVDDPPTIRYKEAGPKIQRSETFGFQITSDATAGPNDSYALVWIYNRPRQRVEGPQYTARASATVTCVAGAWVLGAITMEQDLPSGSYAIVGCDVIGATAVAMRFSFPGGGYSPGLLVQQAAGQFFLDTYRYNNMGYYGVFNNDQPPQIYVLGTAGAVTLTIFMDLVRVGNNSAV